MMDIKQEAVDIYIYKLNVSGGKYTLLKSSL